MSPRGRTTDERIVDALNEAETKAWDSLARYKFQMFGYWCAIWVHLNRISNLKRENPWGGLVRTARRRHAGKYPGSTSFCTPRNPR